MLKCYFSTGKIKLLAAIYLFILQNRCREQTQIINSKCSRVHQAVRKLGEMLNAIFKPKSTEATDEDSVLGTFNITLLHLYSRFVAQLWQFYVNISGWRCAMSGKRGSEDGHAPDDSDKEQLICKFEKVWGFFGLFFLVDPAFITNVLNMKSPSGI